MAGAVISERWLSRHGSGLISFAAGALLAAALLDALPNAIGALGPIASSWAFGGLIAAMSFEWAVGGPRHGSRARGPTLPFTLLATDGLHNIGDGAAIAAAFLHSGRAGLIMSIAVIAHEVPEELGDYSLLRHAGYSRGRAFVALGVVQLTAVVGAAAVAMASAQAERVISVILALASGSFLYIGATDLLPALRQEARRARMAAFSLGVLAIVLAGVIGK